MHINTHALVIAISHIKTENIISIVETYFFEFIGIFGIIIFILYKFKKNNNISIKSSIEEESLSSSQKLNYQEYKTIDQLSPTLEVIDNTTRDNFFNLEEQYNVKYKEFYKNIPIFLASNNIDKFYHFTDEKNLESIIENGGLYSWKGLEDKDINVSLSSDELSRQLDSKKNLQDYIRLSFTDYHPMSTKVEREDGKNLVWLEIDLEVALWESTVFSDINATDNNVTVNGNFDFLKTLDFDVFRKRYSNLDSLEKKKYQAEILVKDFLPIQYIKNIHTVNQPTYKGLFG